MNESKLRRDLVLVSLFDKKRWKSSFFSPEYKDFLKSIHNKSNILVKPYLLSLFTFICAKIFSLFGYFSFAGIPGVTFFISPEQLLRVANPVTYPLYYISTTPLPYYFIIDLFLLPLLTGLALTVWEKRNSLVLYGAFFGALIMGIHGIRGIIIFFQVNLFLMGEYIFPLLLKGLSGYTHPNFWNIPGYLNSVYPILKQLTLVSLFLLLQLSLSILWVLSMIYGALIFRSQMLITLFKKERLPWNEF